MEVTTDVGIVIAVIIMLFGLKMLFKKPEPNSFPYRFLNPLRCLLKRFIHKDLLQGLLL